MKDSDIIRSIREAKGLSRAELSKKINVSDRTISNYELEVNPPSLDYIRRLGETFQVNTDYLFYGKGDMFYTPRPTHEIIADLKGLSTKEISDEYIRVPVIGDSGTPELVFTKEWLKRNNIATTDLSAVYVTGDSMYPTFIQEDTLLVDHSQTAPHMDKIYAVRAGEGIAIKRIGGIEGAMITFVSDNPALRPFTVDLDINNIIIGRVVWFGRII